MSPDFPAERASVRIRSSLDLLRHFLLHQPGIEIHLCLGAQSLGKAALPLNKLIDKKSTEIFMQPISIEETYRLAPKPSLGGGTQVAPIPNDAFPMVGVAIVLKLDENPPLQTDSVVNPIPTITIDETINLTAEAEKDESVVILNAGGGGRDIGGGGDMGAGGDMGGGGDMRLPMNGTQEDPRVAVGPGGDSPLPEGHPDRKEAKTPTSPDVVQIHPNSNPNRDPSSSTSPPDPLPRTSPSAPLPPTQSPFPAPCLLPVPTLQMPAPPSTAHQSFTARPSVAVPPSSHHLCCTVELRSFKDLNASTLGSRFIFMRYLYPFFGFSEPIHTFPATKVIPDSETLLPNSYCAFDFASPLPQLKQTFMNEPFMVEMWGRSDDGGHVSSAEMVDPRTDVLLGIAKLPLSQLIQSAAAVVTGPGGHQIEKRMLPARVTISAIPTSAQPQSLHIGEVTVVLGLEDLGSLDASQPFPASLPREAPPKEASLPEPEIVPPPPPAPPPPAPAPIPPTVESVPRETREYKAALELELWKEQQVEVFEAMLKEKEAKHLQVISEEWKRRDRERELVVKKKIGEYAALETQLRAALNDLEARQKSLHDKEKDLDRLKEDLQREQDTRLMELRESSRRVMEDAEHKISLEKKNSRSLEEQISKLKETVGQLEKKLEAKDREFNSYKLLQSGQPEVKLQQEVHLATLEKHELEKKLEAATKSKLHYKQQWGRALKELARFKQKEADGAKQRLMAQEHELEHLRLRYLVAEEREVAKMENKELQGLRAEVEQLRVSDVPVSGVPSTGQRLADLNGRISRLTSTDTRGDNVHKGTGNNNEENRPDSNVRTSQSPLATPRSTVGQVPSPVPLADGDVSSSRLDEQIARLIEERDTLLQTGVYSALDRIIVELDRQIRDKLAQKNSFASVSNFPATAGLR